MEAAKPVRLAEIAALLGRSVDGDPGVMVSGVASLETAGPGDIAFARSPKYSALVDRTRAGALILPIEMDAGSRSTIRSPNPSLDFARVVERFAVAPCPAPGRHAEAHVAADALLDPSAAIGAGAVVGSGARIGPRTVIHSGVTIYPGVSVGADCVLHAGVVLREGTVMGDRVVLQPGVVLGGDGFGYLADEHGELRGVPHVGRVVIEDDVEIGANSTVDRATLGETRIRRGAKIDNLVQIAHNCDIGEGAIIVAQSGLSGSTVVGARAAIMAQAGSAGHLEVGEGAFVGARSGLHKDVKPGARVYGAPAQEERRWHRAVIAVTRLPDLMRRVRAIERSLGLRPSRPGDSVAEREPHRSEEGDDER
jgi:UDP-3-O-[3-hydroxymyristoyl] glucosamine N-acyltransferase